MGWDGMGKEMKKMGIEDRFFFQREEKIRGSAY